MIFVHPDYQRAGIGSNLMAAGLGHAKQADVTYAWLSVEKRKRYQQQFYNRAGFSVVNSSGVTYRMSRLL
jgi:ribosomal protein S18 acetylase RimI-like enzyme